MVPAMTASLLWLAALHWLGAAPCARAADRRATGKIFLGGDDLSQRMRRV
jgi:hypothetical protein